MRKLAGNHRRSQRPLPTVVGWFDRWIAQEQQHPPTIMLQTDSVQEPLVVVVLQNTRAQVFREFFIDPFDLGLELFGLAGPLVATKLAGFSKDALQLQPKAAGASSLVFQQLINILLEVIQAFLLLYAQELLGIVTLAAVGDHHSRV